MTALAMDFMEADVRITSGGEKFYGHGNQPKRYAAFPNGRGHDCSQGVTILGKQANYDHKKTES
jgi:hypothetical protein